jgi:DNA-binding ferritin-like protein
MKTQDQLTTAKTQDVVTVLNQLLADYQIYYQNLRGLHWNVTGNMFFSLHESTKIITMKQQKWLTSWPNVF